MTISRVFALLMIIGLVGGTFAPSALAASSSSKTTKPSSSSSTLEFSGWVPYWATVKGAADADANLSQLTEVNPFGYTVKSDGSLNDAMSLGTSDWQNLFRDARKKGVKIVPTVMWSDTNGIYNILSSPVTRTAHIQSIVNAVKQNGFDGVDIDYEGKSAETRDAYSAFLGELSAALYKADKNVTLDCTIEARMPLSARYAGTPPANIEYANDLPKVNQYCDRVRVMTYDQQTADLQLNAQHSSELYAPVADTAWVKKVVDYMGSDIDKKKMVIGVATYGAEYQAMSNQDGSGFTYTKTASLNPQYALDTAKQYSITPVRNASGELSFSYVPREQSSMLPSNQQLSALAPKGTPSGLLAALGAIAYAKTQNRQAPVTFLTWSDATAIQDKATLAKKLGVAGIAIFKLDGGEDPAMWASLASVAAPAPAASVSRATNAPVPVIVPVITGTTTPTTTPVSTTTVPVPPTTPPVVNTPPVSAATAFKTDLMFGADGADVTRLQKILITKGYLKASANGHFGPATLAALKAWQQAAGLPATGNLGPLSRAKIAK